MSETENSGIEALLNDYRPSQLDAEVTKVCPLYSESGGKVSSIYSSLHEMARSALLNMLVLRLRGLEIRGEEDCGDGRTDGSVCTPSVDGNSVFDPRGEKLAIIEVKTGQVKLLQAASYSYVQGVPVLMAEFGTGDVHVVSRGTAERLLHHAADQVHVFRELEREEVRIPDKFRCAWCSNADCPYCQSNGKFNGSPKIDEKVEELQRNLPTIVERCVMGIEGLLAERGYKVSERSENLRAELVEIKPVIVEKCAREIEKLLAGNVRETPESDEIVRAEVEGGAMKTDETEENRGGAPAKIHAGTSSNHQNNSGIEKRMSENGVADRDKKA